MATTTYEAKKKELLEDPSVRNWVKMQIIALEARDPCDVADDVEILRELANLRIESALSHARGLARP